MTFVIGQGGDWLPGVSAVALNANLTITAINGLSPSTGDAVLATTAGTPSAGSSDLLAIGDIAEFDGTSWKLIITNSGGFPPAGTKVLIGQTIASPYTASSDEGSFGVFSGSSTTATLVNAMPHGASILCTNLSSVVAGRQLIFALGVGLGVGSWTQANLTTLRTWAQENWTSASTITGTDSALTTTLSAAPVTASLNLYLNGLELRQGAGNDYTISGVTITILASSGTAPDIDTSDLFTAKYQVA